MDDDVKRNHCSVSAKNVDLKQSATLWKWKQKDVFPYLKETGLNLLSSAQFSLLKSLTLHQTALVLVANSERSLNH